MLTVASFTGGKLSYHKSEAHRLEPGVPLLLLSLGFYRCSICASLHLPQKVGYRGTSVRTMVQFVLLTNSQMCLGFYRRLMSKNQPPSPCDFNIVLASSWVIEDYFHLTRCLLIRYLLSSQWYITTHALMVLNQCYPTPPIK